MALRTVIFIVQKARESTRSRAEFLVSGESQYCTTGGPSLPYLLAKGGRQAPAGFLNTDACALCELFVHRPITEKPYFSTVTLKIRFHYMGGGAG